MVMPRQKQQKHTKLLLQEKMCYYDLELAKF